MKLKLTVACQLTKSIVTKHLVQALVPFIFDCHCSTVKTPFFYNFNNLHTKQGTSCTHCRLFSILCLSITLYFTALECLVSNPVLKKKKLWSSTKGMSSFVLCTWQLGHPKRDSKLSGNIHSDSRHLDYIQWLLVHYSSAALR